MKGNEVIQSLDGVVLGEASNYQDPIHVFQDKTYRKHPESTEQIYSQPTENVECNSTEFRRERYENMASLFAGVEYGDNRLIHEPLKSKLDILETIVLTKNMTPATKPRPKVDKFVHKQGYSSVRLTPKSPKKIPPKPKPRPNTVLYERPFALNIVPESKASYITENVPKRSTDSVRKMAAQMRGKIQPASLIPSMTQAKLNEQENTDYQNI